jgi:hypothetical protein
MGIYHELLISFPELERKTLTVDYRLGFTVICHICCSADALETIEISDLESGQAALRGWASLKKSLCEFFAVQMISLTVASIAFIGSQKDSHWEGT